MNDDAFDFPKAYRLSRLGFFLLAVGMVPCSILSVALLAGRFTDRRLVSWIDHSGLIDMVDVLTPWATLAGSSILWTAWDTKSWRRRAGLLMSLCLLDVCCWIINLGDPNGVGEHAFFRSQLQAAMGWAQFALMASLCCDMLVHLGVEQAEESSKSTRSLAATGAVIWMLLFLEITNLDAGWPLQRAPGITIHARILWLGKIVIHTICMIQVTALVVASFRRLLVEVDAQGEPYPRKSPDAPDPDEDFAPFSRDDRSPKA